MKVLCRKCGKRVALDKSHTCVGPYSELEEAMPTPERVLCSGCGEKVAPFLTHECIGWDGKPEKSILPWWVDTMKDQLAEDPRSNRGGGASNLIPWYFWPVVGLAIMAALAIMYLAY